ncbi:hypothetical protein PENSPDRAFT_646755 [Peniophora sp. CONT]|nr:hypothetical protein PENSPDRAFT_646755 [Peniophora sp. CONT]
MQAHGLLSSSNPFSLGSTFRSLLDDDDEPFGQRLGQPVDSCPVCEHLEDAAVTEQGSNEPEYGQVHVMLESLFLPVARLLQDEHNPLMEHLNTSVDRFVRDRSCKLRPAIITRVYDNDEFDVYLVGTKEGGKGSNFPHAVDGFMTPIDPCPNVDGVLHPHHVHSSPRWISDSQAYVVTAKLTTEPETSTAMGHVRESRWKEYPKGQPAGKGTTFRFHDRQLERIECIHEVQWGEWMAMKLEKKNEYIIQLQKCLDDKAVASERRRREDDSQSQRSGSSAAVNSLLSKADSTEEGFTGTVSINSLQANMNRRSRFTRPGPPTVRTFVSKVSPLERVDENEQSHSSDATANHRLSIASTSASEPDSDGPRTPEQTPATLSNPHVVGRDRNPDHSSRSIIPGEAQASTSSSSARISLASSKRRTHLDPIPVRDGESHKESRRRKQSQRASIDSSRTAKGENATDIGAGDASEPRSGGGGFLRRMASKASNLSRMKM